MNERMVESLLQAANSGAARATRRGSRITVRFGIDSSQVLRNHNPTADDDGMLLHKAVVRRVYEQAPGTLPGMIPVTTASGLERAVKRACNGQRFGGGRSYVETLSWRNVSERETNPYPQARPVAEVLAEMEANRD